MTKGTTRKDHEVNELRIVDLFETTDLNRREIAELLNMTGSEVGNIVRRYHAVKGIQENDRDPNFNPCMLSIEAWPRCFGQRCYWAAAGVDSVCPAFAATLKVSTVYE